MSTICVGPAGKIGDGVNAYHVFKVFKTVAGPEVDRRYSDFLWLHTQLSKQFAGFIIPPLPPKVVGLLQGPEFLENRRMGLERFLRKVIDHEELRTSNFLKSFLECSPVELTAIKAEVTKADTKHLNTVAQKTQALNTWWGKAYQRMTENEKVKQLAAKAGKDLSSPNHVEDLEFEKLLKYVTELSHQAKSLQTKAINLHRQNKLAAGAYCELIEAINMIADTEESHSDISSALFGGLISLLDTRARQIDGEMNDFSNAVDDFSRWVSAVFHAVNVREDRRFVYQAKLAASSKRDTQHTESQPDGGNTVPSTASQELVEAKEEFEKVHSRIMSEIVRFRMEKSIEFKRLFNNYTQLQLKYHQEMATVLANTSKIMEDSTPSTKLATVVPTISEELINDMKKLDLVTPHTNSSISKPAPAPVLDAKPNPSDPSYADVCL